MLLPARLLGINHLTVVKITQARINTHVTQSNLHLHGQRGVFYQTTVVWEWVDKRVRRRAWGPAGRWNQALFVLFAVLCLFGLLPAEWLKLWKEKLPVFCPQLDWNHHLQERKGLALSLWNSSERSGLHHLKMSSNVWNVRSHWTCSRTVGIYYLLSSKLSSGCLETLNRCVLSLLLNGKLNSW